MSNLETIKKLRKASGAGMADCKKALEETDGDLDKAIENLRKSGIAKAAKRSDRDASEGVIKLLINESGNEGYAVEINAETDFVARNEKFLKLADDILDVIAKKKPGNLDELYNISMENCTVKETIDNLSGTIGEKMDIKGFDIITTKGTVAVYSHMGGRIGVVVALDKPREKDLAYEIAMQVAATNPKYIDPEDVPVGEIDKEKEIYREQLIKEGKPENIIDKILEGKVNKYFTEVCLTKQEYIKEDKKKVEEILGGVKVERFIRYSL